VRYSYKYDGFGNWTEQRTSSATSADDANVIRRTLIFIHVISKLRHQLFASSQDYRLGHYRDYEREDFDQQKMECSEKPHC
jgi:hypothetical protein